MAQRRIHQTTFAQGTVKIFRDSEFDQYRVVLLAPGETTAPGRGYYTPRKARTMSNQPLWILLAQWDDHAVYADLTARYAPEIEHFETSDDERTECPTCRGAKTREVECDDSESQATIMTVDCEDCDGEGTVLSGQLYRWSLDRCRAVDLVDGMTSTLIVTDDPDHDRNHPEWFSEDLARVAQSCSMTARDLALGFASPSPRERAHAYLCVVGYYGANNFDGYPLDLTVAAFEARDRGARFPEDRIGLLLLGSIGAAVEAGEEYVRRQDRVKIQYVSR